MRLICIARATNTLLNSLLCRVIKLYKFFISPLLPAACRYFPSCSEYAHDAVKHYGMLKGTSIAVKRLLRCGPWGGYGIDPLPLSNIDKITTLNSGKNKLCQN